MPSQLRAFAVLGRSSVVSLLVSLVAMKAYAIMIGPAGVGQIGVIQGLGSLAALVAGMGIGTAVVRFGRPLLSAGDEARARRLFAHARRITVGTSLLTLTVAIVLRDQLAALLLGEASWGWIAVVAVTGGVLGAWATLELGLLNARHAVDTIARATVAGSVGAALIGVGLVWSFGVGAVPIAIVLGQLWTAVVAAYLSSRATGGATTTSEVLPASSDNGSLVRFGASYTLSMFLGVGIQYALPSFVVHQSGFDAAGHVRAALTISTAYLAVFLTAMARDYYPRVCAARSVDELNQIVNTQMGILLLLGVPMVLALQVGAPVALALLFSSAFGAAAEMLRWQLVGEVFKFASWTFAFVILGRLSQRRYLLSETTAGATLLAGTWFLAPRRGIEGVGLAYAGSYLCYFLLTMGLVRGIGVRVSRTNGTYFAAAVAGATLIAVLQTSSVMPLQFSLALQIAIAVGALAIAARIAHRAGAGRGGLLQQLRATMWA